MNYYAKAARNAGAYHAQLINLFKRELITAAVAIEKFSAYMQALDDMGLCGEGWKENAKQEFNAEVLG